MSEYKKKNSFFKSVSVLLLNIFHKVIYTVSSVYKLSGNWFNLTFIEYIAMNVAYICNACNNACTVAVSQTSFDVIFFIKTGINNGIFLYFIA